MPRRTKAYIGPGKTLVNGGRVDLPDDANEATLVAIVPEVNVDVESIRNKVAVYIQQFDELAQLANRDQFIKDVADECVWARTLRLDHLTRGTRTKPGGVDHPNSGNGPCLGYAAARTESGDIGV